MSKIDIEEVEDNGEFFVEAPVVDDFIVSDEQEQQAKFEIIDNNTVSEALNKPKTTIPYLTKYEKAALIGFRAEEISRGAEAVIDPVKHGLTDTIAIARKELEERVIPCIIKRQLPNGEIEYWRIEDLIF